VRFLVRLVGALLGVIVLGLAVVVTVLVAAHQPGVVSSVVPESAVVVTPPAEPVASGVPALRGRESPIDHIIVIFLENHTFDNLYGKFPGANGLDRPGARVPQAPYDFTSILRFVEWRFDLPATGTRPASNLLRAFEFPSAPTAGRG
jgi:hypothetical protein